MYEFFLDFFTQKQDENCEVDPFNKIKYGNQVNSHKQLYDEYGKNVVQGKIMFELVLKIDTFKTATTRDATKVFDYLGLVGGFAAAFEGILSVVGAFFSSRFLASSIAQNLYI